MNKNTRFVMMVHETVMRKIIRKLSSLPFAVLYVLSVSLIIVIILVFVIISVRFDDISIVDKINNILKYLQENSLVVAIPEVILAIVILWIRHLSNQRDKMDPSKLVKELDFFWIKEAAAQKLANEFQPKNLEMLTQKDYQFSSTHYEFLCNSLKKYIEDNFSQNSSYFFNASVIKIEKENIIDILSQFKPISVITTIITTITAVLSSSGLANLKQFLNVDTNDLKDYFDTETLIFGAIGFVFVYVIFIKTQKNIEDTKKTFYLSILNQLKEEINGEQNKGKNSKGPVPSEENPTADLPGVGNGSNDNDNADKS